MGKRSRRHRRKMRNIYKRPAPTADLDYDDKKDRYVWRTGPGPEKPATAPLYFAYGSNLNVAQMRLRCPNAVPFARFNYPNWKLAFRGVADIVPEPGAVVNGGLWRITAACEWALDRYEGVSSGLYTKEYFTVIYTDAETGEKKIEDCLVYVMGRGSSFEKPWTGYLNTIREGYKDFGLDEAPLLATVEATPKRPPVKRYAYTPKSREGYTPSERSSYQGWGGHWSDGWGDWGDEDEWVKDTDGTWRQQSEIDRRARDLAAREAAAVDRADAFLNDKDDWPDWDDDDAWEEYVDRFDKMYPSAFKSRDE